jgi:hypothetical protein
VPLRYLQGRASRMDETPAGGRSDMRLSGIGPEKRIVVTHL